MIEINRINYSGLNKESMLDYFDDMPKDFKTKHKKLNIVRQNPAQNAELSSSNRFKRILQRKKRRLVIKDFLTDESKIQIDLEEVLMLNNDVFISELIFGLYRRDIEHDEFMKYLKMILEGVSRYAVVYIACNSNDMDASIAIEDFDKYEKAYKKHVVKRRIDKIPVINYICALFCLPITISKIKDSIAVNEIACLNRHNSIANQLLKQK